jgi:ribosome biogenesis GTPase A
MRVGTQAMIQGIVCRANDYVAFAPLQLSLLRDAVRQLDEPFLVVVVGEFNSGKSSVINALLGGKFLAEGILPTTNEISILK